MSPRLAWKTVWCWLSLHSTCRGCYGDGKIMTHLESATFIWTSVNKSIWFLWLPFNICRLLPASSADECDSWQSDPVMFWTKWLNVSGCLSSSFRVSVSDPAGWRWGRHDVSGDTWARHWQGSQTRQEHTHSVFFFSILEVFGKWNKRDICSDKVHVMSILTFLKWKLSRGHACSEC